VRGQDANGDKSVGRDFRVGEEMIVAEVVDLGSCAFQIPAGISDAGCSVRAPDPAGITDAGYSRYLARRALEKFVQRLGGGEDWPG